MRVFHSNSLNKACRNRLKVELQWKCNEPGDGSDNSLQSCKPGTAQFPASNFLGTYNYRQDLLDEMPIQATSRATAPHSRRSDKFL
jgi:hypothetical protein